MKFPLYTFEVETNSEKDFVRSIQRELNSLPSVVERNISDRDRLAFRLTLEDFVVGLLKEMTPRQSLSRLWMTPSYTLLVQIEKTQASIFFNGQEKIIRFTEE